LVEEHLRSLDQQVSEKWDPKGRSVDELNRERNAMLLELLATRAKGEAAAKAAIAGGHGD
jgi:hypothetical protein